MNKIVKMPSILIVDDNTQLRTLLRLQLKRLGCECDEAENGLLALQLVKEKHYSLILMDIAMPIMDGFEATRKIREYQTQAKGQRTRIIAITGQGDPQECIKRGMDAHLQKPVLMTTLTALLHDWFGI